MAVVVEHEVSFLLVSGSSGGHGCCRGGSGGLRFGIGHEGLVETGLEDGGDGAIARRADDDASAAGRFEAERADRSAPATGCRDRTGNPVPDAVLPA